MNTTEIQQLIEQIAATSSKKEKEALLKARIDDPELQRVLVHAYDPFYVYGVGSKMLAQVHAGGATPGQPFDASTWDMLNQLKTGALSGDAAVAAITEQCTRLNIESVWLLRCILLKDLRAGFSESTINKAKKGLIPDFPYMRCSLPHDSNLGDWDWSKGVISQEKADGSFANVNVGDDGRVWVTTRQGSLYPDGTLDDLVGAIGDSLVRGHQHHGELLVFKTGDAAPLPREISNGHLNSLLSGGKLDAGLEVRFYAWDMIPLTMVQTKGRFDVGYLTRLTRLINALNLAGPRTRGLVNLIPSRIVRSRADAWAHFRELLLQGKEGTIVKHPDAIWRDGTSKDQVKLKLEADVDLKVVAIVPGRANTKNEGRAGSLTCVSSCGELKVDVAVKNEKMRDEVDASPNDWLERIVTVRANMVLEPSESSELHSLFLPRLVEAAYRRDKNEADSLQRVRDQFRAAMEAA